MCGPVHLPIAGRYVDKQMSPKYRPLKATIHRATLLLATVVTRLWQPCSRVVTAWLQPGYNCCKQQSCPVYGGLYACMSKGILMIFIQNLTGNDCAPWWGRIHDIEWRLDHFFSSAYELLALARQMANIS